MQHLPEVCTGVGCTVCRKIVSQHSFFHWQAANPHVLVLRPPPIEVKWENVNSVSTTPEEVR